jgi:hypothetical protein
MREAACVNDDSGLNDMLVFELPDLDLATELTKRLEDYWACAIHEDLGVAVVTAFLTSDGDSELAPLLRRVESWVAARSLGAIRYWLDRRAYILEAGSTSDVPVFTQVR